MLAVGAPFRAATEVPWRRNALDGGLAGDLSVTIAGCSRPPDPDVRWLQTLPTTMGKRHRLPDRHARRKRDPLPVGRPRWAEAASRAVGELRSASCLDVEC